MFDSEADALTAGGADSTGGSVLARAIEKIKAGTNKIATPRTRKWIRRFHKRSQSGYKQLVCQRLFMRL
ncbi:MAG: hypothetical protein HYR80_01250 [Nitrospirae bacterium]|nr:hypothetical protein [Nitrospirota bacterium]